MDKNRKMAAVIALIALLHFPDRMLAQTDQFRSMEFRQWEFTPSNYYYSKYWGTILKMPWPLPDIKGYKPGEGFHDKGKWLGLGIYIPVIFNPYALAAGHWEAVFSPDGYVSESWRKKTPLRIAAVGESEIHKNNNRKSMKEWKTIRDIDLTTIADREGIVLFGEAYSSTKEERDRYSQLILDYLDKIDDNDARNKIEEQYDKIMEEVSVIKSAHMDNARKLEQFYLCNRRLKSLANTAGLVAYFATYNNRYINN